MRWIRSACWRLLCCLCLVSAVANAETKPNIIILLADDLGYGDLGSYGSPYIRTPRLDELAAQGQRWTDFYMAAPVCSPSRAALLTGRLPPRTGMYGEQIAVFFPNASTGMPASEHTLGEVLQSQGYRTGIIGKWHLGDAPEHFPTRHGFDYWFGLPYSNDMDWVDEPNFLALREIAATVGPEKVLEIFGARMRKYMDPKVAYWDVPLMRSQVTEEGFDDGVVQRPAQQHVLTEQYTDEALAFIERNQEQSFFLYLPYTMPHTPLFASEAFANRSIGGAYGDVVEEIDASVGTIVDKLRELDLAENTLLVFTSDNGPWLLMNTHGGSAGLLRDGKGTTHEGGMRVPAIFWWPGKIAPGQVVSEVGSAMDLFDTALSLAGAQPAVQTDGYDLSGTLLHGQSSARNTVFYYRGGLLRAYRKGPYKLRLVTEGVYGQPPARTVHSEPLLYHLHNDPSERFNIAAMHPAIVQEMQQDIVQHQKELESKPSIFDRQFDHLVEADAERTP